MLNKIKDKRLVYCAAAIVLTIIFVGLAWLAAASATAWPHEVAALTLIRPLANEALVVFFILITYLASWPTIVFLGLITVWWLSRQARYPAILFITATVLAEIITILTKELVRRPRPAFENEIWFLASFGFPSGHAMVGLVFYGLIGFFLFQRAKNFWLKAAVATVSASLIFLIGFSRLYLGVHWPLDVVGGWLAGLVILLLSIIVIEKYRIIKTGH